MTLAPHAQPHTLDAAVIDSSALMCILMGEPAAPLFINALQKTGKLYIGAATRAEVWLAAFNAKGRAGAQHVEALLAALQVQTLDFTSDALPHFVEGTPRRGSTWETFLCMRWPGKSRCRCFFKARISLTRPLKMRWCAWAMECQTRACLNLHKV